MDWRQYTGFLAFAGLGGVWIGSFSPGFDMFNPQWGTSAVGATVNGQRPLLAAGQLENTFPNLHSKANRQIKLLYVACGTEDDHLFLTRQFKDFLDARKIKVTYVDDFPV